MRLVLALALLSLPASVTAADGPLSARGAKCPGAPTAHYAAVLRDKAPAARTLDREPPGKLILSVQREWNGCPELAVMRTNVGATRFEPASKGR